MKIKLNKIYSIISLVSLCACIALSVVCINTKRELNETKQSISDYASKTYLKMDGKYYTLQTIINKYGERIDDISKRQLTMQTSINRSNRFLDDYNIYRMSGQLPPWHY